MKNSFFQARLIDENTIRMLVFSEIPQSDKKVFYLIKDGKIIEELKAKKTVTLKEIFIFELKPTLPYDYGHEYEIFVPAFSHIPVDATNLVFLPDFDEKFAYDGNDLGNRYTKEYTDFALWAPISSNVKLVLYRNETPEYFDMERSEKGVYRVRIQGDLKNVLYKYMVTNNSSPHYVVDPYAFACGHNSSCSAVVDLAEIASSTPHEKYSFDKPLVEASIYEVNIRDFTINKDTDIENKGKYLGFIEEGRKTKGNNPAGLDYLKYLGVSHVQLQPILDFANVDDKDFQKSYNWGYDAYHFFNIEGSYCSNSYDPSNRISEFRQVVNKLHKENIGVILDVVYNHVWAVESHYLEAIVPGYYFRRNRDLRLSNTSGCGNDVYSDRPMTRKLITDSLLFLTKYYDVDGFRFDLMGLLDIETIETALKECRKIKPHVEFYGEGWAMPSPLKGDDACTILNSFNTPEIGFFNDAYRDILKGSNFNIGDRGYLNGDYSYVDGVYYSIMATIVDYVFPPRFKDACQSINYVECHDNATLFDKLRNSCDDSYDDEDILKIITLANALIAFSFGVPFYHMGQEIGLTKFDDDNTYNKGDLYNQMDYSVLDKRFSMASYFRDCLKMRKKFSAYKLHKKEDIESFFTFGHLDNGGFYLKTNKMEGYDEVYCFCNPTKESIYIDMEGYYSCLFLRCGVIDNPENEIQTSHLIVSPFNLVWIAKKKEAK